MNKNIVFLGGEDVSARIEISKKIIALGYNLSIIGSESKKKFNENNINYTHYSLNRELNIFNDIKTVFQLRKILKLYKSPVIVHAFDTKPTFILPIASMGLKNILVCRTITGVGRIFTEKSIKNDLLIFIYKCIQKIVKSNVKQTIFQNVDDYKYFIDNKLINKSKASIIKSSGINLNKYDPKNVTDISELRQELNLEHNCVTCIMVARMVKQKGVVDYLEAAKKCYELRHKINFILVGQLDTKKDSVPLSTILKYKKYVKYLGRRSDIKQLLSISDIFILPTYYREGVPRVLLEASAMGLALIATNMPGCKDVVIDGINGRLVKIKDPCDLSKKIISIANNKITLNYFASNNESLIGEFDLNIITEKYLKVYSKIN